jgi:hypothetical protein
MEDRSSDPDPMKQVRNAGNFQGSELLTATPA